MLDLNAICRELEEVCEHYERSAPTVCAWANDLYVRIGEQPETVVLPELLAACRLRYHGEWTQPNYAANDIYKLMSRLGRETVGHAGY